MTENKIKKYTDLINNYDPKKNNIIEYCKNAKISKATFYKYKKMFNNQTLNKFQEIKLTKKTNVRNESNINKAIIFDIKKSLINIVAYSNEEIIELIGGLYDRFK